MMSFCRRIKWSLPRFLVFKNLIQAAPELEPADGWSNYKTYLVNNINVPEDLRRTEEPEGQVQLSFEVNQEGNPINIRVEKSLCEKCDEEAVRVVKQGPKWKKKNKKAKRITISVPFDTDQ
jgi:TonB family protein